MSTLNFGISEARRSALQEMLDENTFSPFMPAREFDEMLAMGWVRQTRIDNHYVITDTGRAVCRQLGITPAAQSTGGGS